MRAVDSGQWIVDNEGQKIKVKGIAPLTLLVKLIINRQKLLRVDANTIVHKLQS